MATTDKDVRGAVRAVVAEYSTIKTDGLSDSDDLFAAGMTSQASVAVMLGVEDSLDIEFPDAMLTRSVFTSVDSITEAVESLVQGG